MHSDWLTENVNKFADWSKMKFSLFTMLSWVTDYMALSAGAYQVNATQ